MSRGATTGRCASSIIDDVAAEGQNQTHAVAAAEDSWDLSWVSRTRQGWVQPRTAAHRERRAHAPGCVLEAEERS